MEKNVSICPRCGRVYKHVVDKTQNCFERTCGAVETVFSGYTEFEWEKLNGSTKQEIIENVANGNITNDPFSSTTPNSVDPTTSVKGTSFWISLLDTIADLYIWIGILGSLVIGLIISRVMANIGIDYAGWICLAFIFLGTVLTLILSASVKVFLGIAKDIHYLRKSEEQKNKK